MKTLKIILLLAVFALLGACSSTDENGVTITKRGLFAASDSSIDFNS